MDQELLGLAFMLVVLVPVSWILWFWLLRGWRLIQQDLAKLRLRGVSLETIDELDGFEFEAWVTEALRAQGYRAEDLPNVGDRGGDVMAQRGNERPIVFQVKRYSSSVGNKPVQELMQAFSHYGVRRGAVITNSLFTDAAREAAQELSQFFDVDIVLMDRWTIKEWMERGYGSTKELCDEKRTQT